MADNKDNRNITAGDLLSRLSKKTDAHDGQKETERHTYLDFIKEKETAKTDAVNVDGTADVIPEESETPPEISEEEPVSLSGVPEEEPVTAPEDAMAEELPFDEEQYLEEMTESEDEIVYIPEVSEEEYYEPVQEQPAEEIVYDNGTDQGDYSDYIENGGDYVGDDALLQTEDGYTDYPEPLGYADEVEIPEENFDGQFDGNGEYNPDEYTGEDYASYSEDGQYTQMGDGDPNDFIVDDDFFDNDPIEEYDEVPMSEEVEYAESEGEISEEEDFNNLVAEVTGEESEDGFDDVDIALAVALGMEDELQKKIGTDTVTQATDDYIADQEEWVDKSDRFGAGEYYGSEQNAEIAESYKVRNKKCMIKMLLTLLLTVVVLIYENMALFGYKFSGALDFQSYPVVYIMADLQLLFFAAALNIRSIGRGFAGLLKLKPTVESIPAFMTLLATVVSFTVSLTTVPGTEPQLFTFSAVLCIFFMSLNEYLTVLREIFSFNIVSSKKPKFVLRRLSTRDSIMESEAVAGIDSPTADEGDIIKIQKTDFVDGYFWHTDNHGYQNRSLVSLAMIISVVLAVIIGAIAAFKGNAPAASAGFAAISAAMPASMIFVACYPFYRANKQAYEHDSTIIGEGAVEEYSGIGVISFDDVNVFPSSTVKVRNVRLFNNSRIDKVLYYASSVFSATGGPLSDVFEVATMETGRSDNVKILETGSGYIEALVNGKNIIFAKSPALATLGIVIPEDLIYEDTELPADCSVMYMIYQRKLVAKMIVNYVIDQDFEYVLRQLTGSGMCICVKTFDPNIDEDLILRCIKAGNYSLRVIKYKNTEEITKYTKHAEGGIVSRGTTKSLLHTVSQCDRIISAQKTGYVIGILAALFGSVVVGVLLLSGNFASMHSLYSALCQLFWMIPALITTKMIVR